MTGCDPRIEHLGTLICQRYSNIGDIAKAAHKVSETIPSFTEHISFFYALSRSGGNEEKPQRTGKIYFMSDGKGRIKIGYTDNNVYGRQKAHAVFSGGDMAVLLVLDGCYSDETNFHQMYDRHRYNGEWYTATQEVMESITAMANMAAANPHAPLSEVMTEGKWSLFFWKKEAECYKRLITCN